MPAAGEPAIGATRPPRTLLPIILWSAGIIFVLGVTWGSVHVYVSIRETHAIVKDVHFGDFTAGGPPPNQRVIWPEGAIKMLGGEERAARKLALYLWWPRSLPPRRPGLDYRTTAIYLIHLCGHAALGPITRAARDRDPYVREAAANVIDSVSPAAAVPIIIDLLNDPAPFVRNAAIKSLVRLKLEPKVAVPLFVKCLGDADSSNRWFAADALRQIGPPAKDAVPFLEKLLQDENGQVRYIAAEALKEIRRPAGGEPREW